MNEPTKVCSRKDCPHGGVPQPLGNFYRQKGMRDGRRSECRACYLAQQRAKNRRALRDTPDGVQRNTLYVRAYRARKRAAKEHTA